MIAPPGSPLAKARIAAHRALDVWWEFDVTPRKEVYGRLAKEMEMSKSDCHIANFDEAQCARVIEICAGWAK